MGDRKKKEITKLKDKKKKTKKKREKDLPFYKESIQFDVVTLYQKCFVSAKTVGLQRLYLIYLSELCHSCVCLLLFDFCVTAIYSSFRDEKKSTMRQYATL